jgi:hypothetical protein
MSRSYKKYSGYVDRDPFMKAYANRTFRRNTFDFPSGRSYRKFTCSWNIKDYSSIYFSEQEAITISVRFTKLDKLFGIIESYDEAVKRGKRNYAKGKRK